MDQETGGFTGLLVELLPLLFMAAGYSTTASSFSYYTAPTNSGGSFKNGSWNGAPALHHMVASSTRLAFSADWTKTVCSAFAIEMPDYMFHAVCEGAVGELVAGRADIAAVLLLNVPGREEVRVPHWL